MICYSRNFVIAMFVITRLHYIDVVCIWKNNGSCNRPNVKRAVFSDLFCSPLIHSLKNCWVFENLIKSINAVILIQSYC